MNYCINPRCTNRKNEDDKEYCENCKTPLLIHDKFRLLSPVRPIDSDSYSEVFEAVLTKNTFENKSGSFFIIKIVKVPNKLLIELLEREAHILRSNNDPGIPRVYFDDYFTVKIPELSFELNCLAISKIDGQNLQEWLESGNKLTEQLAINWLKQISRILKVIHSKNFFHRDIKPSNIMYKTDGTLALIDFGASREVTDTYLGRLVKNIDSQTEIFSLEGDVTLVNTVGYSPPEQLNGQALPQSDFYALGRTFVHLLTGIHPKQFPINPITGGITWRNKAKQIRKPLADFIDELMSFLPADRPKTAELISGYLERKLPVELRTYQLINSKCFKVLFIVIVMAFSLIFIKGLSYGVARYYYSVGLISYGRKEYDSAKLNFQKSIFFDKKFSEAYNNLAETCKYLNQQSCAENNYKKAISLDKNNWIPYYTLASYYDDLSHSSSKDDKKKYLTLARNKYERAIEVGKSDAVDALNNLARLEILDGKYIVALNYTEQGIKSNSDPLSLSILYKNKGWALIKLHRFSAAYVAFVKSITLKGNRADAYCLTVYDIKSIQHDVLKDYLKKCLKYNTENTEIKLIQDFYISNLVK